MLKKQGFVGMIFFGNTLSVLPRMWIKNATDLEFRSDIDVAFIIKNGVTQKQVDYAWSQIYNLQKSLLKRKIKADFFKPVSLDDLDTTEVSDIPYSIRTAIKNNDKCFIWTYNGEPFKFKYKFDEIRLSPYGYIAIIRTKGLAAYDAMCELIKGEEKLEVLRQDQILKYIVQVTKHYLEFFPNEIRQEFKEKFDRLLEQYVICSEKVITRENVKEYINQLSDIHLSLMSKVLKKGITSWGQYVLICTDYLTELPDDVRNKIKSILTISLQRQDRVIDVELPSKMLFDLKTIEQRKAIFLLILPFGFYTEAQKDNAFVEFVRYALGISERVNSLNNTEKIQVLQSGFDSAKRLLAGMDNAAPIKLI